MTEDHGLALLSKCQHCFDGLEPRPEDDPHALHCRACAGYMYVCGACGGTFDAHPEECPMHARLPAYLQNPPLEARPRRLDWFACPRQEPFADTTLEVDPLRDAVRERVERAIDDAIEEAVAAKILRR